MTTTPHSRLFDRSQKVALASPVKAETIAGNMIRMTLRAPDGELFTRDIRKIVDHSKKAKR